MLHIHPTVDTTPPTYKQRKKHFKIKIVKKKTIKYSN